MKRMAGLFAIAAVLLAIIAWEIGSAPQPSEAPSHPPARLGASPANEPQADLTRDWITTVLARPLFSPDRRPAPNTPVVSGTGLPGLPRLTGILVGPFGRSAIFVANGRKPIVVAEGARIEAYTVKSIEAAGVRVLGPEGMQVLHPTFQPSPDRAAGSGIPPHRIDQVALPR
jgi:hypothetical protein